MKLLNTFWEFFKAKPTTNAIAARTYEEKIGLLIKGVNEFKEKGIENLKWETSSNYYHDKTEEIIALVKSLDFETIKSKFCAIPATFDDLSYFSFTDEFQKKYVAIIYDSDELWQDPQIFEIITIDT